MKKILIAVILGINFLFGKLNLIIKSEHKTYYTTQNIHIKVELKNQGSAPEIIIPFEVPHTLFFKVWKEGKKTFKGYKGGFANIYPWSSDTLSPGEKWKYVENLLFDYHDYVIFPKQTKKKEAILPIYCLKEGKYYVQAIFRKAIPNKKGGFIILDTIYSNIISFEIVSGKGKSDWESYQQALLKGTYDAFLSFVQKFPNSVLAPEAYYKAVVEISILSRVKPELKKEALKIFRDFILKYPESHYTEGVPIRIWVNFGSDEKDKAKALLDSLIDARPYGEFVENAKKIIEKYYKKEGER